MKIHQLRFLILYFAFFLVSKSVNAQNQSRIESLLDSVANGVPDTLRIQLWNEIADEYNASDSSNTFLYALKAIQLSKEISYPKGMVDAYYIMAWSAIRTGHYSYADELCNRAYYLADSIDYLRGKTKALNGLGVVQRHLGNFRKALEYQFESLAIEENTGDLRGQSGTYNNIGFIYAQQDDNKASLRYYLKSLEIKLDQGFQKGLSQNYYNIGNIYFDEENYDSALYFFKKAFDISKTDNNIRSISSGYSNIGKVYLAQNNFELALDYLEKSLALSYEMSNKGKVASNSIMIGQVFLALGDYKKATEFIEQGITISRELNSPYLLNYGFNILSQVKFAEGNYRLAYQIRLEYEALNDSLRNDEKMQQMARVEAEYQFQKEKNELELEREREQLAYQLDINRRKFIQRISYFGLIFLVLLLILIYANFRTKQKANKNLKKLNDEIQTQNIEIKSQRDHLEDTLVKLQKTQSHLLETEKMASLGILTTGVAHEVNNPLNYIKGAYEALKKHFNEYPPPNDSVVPELLESINEGISRTSAIVKGLNEFGKDSSDNNESCYIHAIIENCLVMLNNKTMHRISVVKSYCDFEIIVSGNTGKLHQVFLNILTNAVQAITGKGEIKISTMIEQDVAVIEVIDTGKGIPSENLPKIADPFFTTKNPGEGTGLGLSISYNIIQEHNGNIEISSKVEEGTCVKIQFSIKKVQKIEIS